MKHTLEEMLAGAEDDMLFVAAAGNENEKVTSRSLMCNANAPNQICVAASDERDTRGDNWGLWGLGGSNWGLPYVDVFAPGEDILSTVLENKYQSQTGKAVAYSIFAFAVSFSCDV